jgi:hypothetical protein
MTSRRRSDAGFPFDAAGEILLEFWQEASDVPLDACALPAEIMKACERSVNSSTKSYRYVLPTQLLAVVVDSSLDCRCVQVSTGQAGSFDARSICQRVIVPFDRENHRVLGGSPEPYVNNPLRIPGFFAEEASAQRDSSGFQDLRTVLEWAHANPRQTRKLLRFVLAVVRNRLQSVQIAYPVPIRTSLKDALRAIDAFLAEKSGGARLQAVVAALFKAVGFHLHLFDEVSTASITTSDTHSGRISDIECRDENGNILLAVEVKDDALSMRHIQDKIPVVREHGIRELLFLARGTVEFNESTDALLAGEFAAGQNIYAVMFPSFLESRLVLLGEIGRREFLQQVGVFVDAVSGELTDREAWRDQLRAI